MNNMNIRRMAHQEQSKTTKSLCALNVKKMSSFATIHHLGNKSLETPENKKDTSVLRSHHNNNLCWQTIPKRCKESNTSQIVVCWC